MRQITPIEIIFEKILRNECSPKEIDELIRAIGTSEEASLNDLILKQLQSPTSGETLSDEAKSKLDEGLKSILNKKDFSSDSVTITMTKKNSFAKFWYAAAVILLLLGGSWWFVASRQSAQSPALGQVSGEKENVPVDFVPGGNKAILMTGNGHAIDLEERVNKEIKDGMAVIKSTEGRVEYKQEDFSAATVDPVYHTLIIPRGGKYNITLSDGTSVWLNAASSLHFPEVFSGAERVVELTGEAYFEVAKNVEKPFKVKINGMLVHVTGTHFNVNGYPENEGVKTTLVEGSVRVVTKSDSAALAPGDQIAFRKNRLEPKRSGVNVEQIVAWKNNHFDFTNETLSVIARQLSRWYQVNIVVDDAIATTHMSGIISRENKISKVLEVFSFSAGIDYKFQDNNTIYLFKK